MKWKGLSKERKQHFQKAYKKRRIGYSVWNRVNVFAG
jgi:hypothetical protein